MIPTELRTALASIRVTGDKAGHEFHGNQYSDKKDRVRGSIGQVSSDGSVESKEDRGSGINGKLVSSADHADLFSRRAHPSQKFRMQRNTIFWDDTPSADDYFSVENHYHQMGVAITNQVSASNPNSMLSVQDLMRAAGENTGHDFHGNQWTPGGPSKFPPSDKRSGANVKKTEWTDHAYAMSKTEQKVAINDIFGTKLDTDNAFFEAERTGKSLVAGVGDKFDMTVDVGSYSVKYQYEGEDGTRIAYTLLRDDDNKLVVHHDFFELPDAQQGKGIAKEVLRSNFAEYDRLGVDHVELLADIDSGKYAWARFGYVPASDKVASKLYNELAARVKTSGAPADLELELAAEAKKPHPNPELLWKVADSKDGFKLLAGKKSNDWQAVLDLKNERQTDRLAKYLVSKPKKRAAGEGEGHAFHGNQWTPGGDSGLHQVPFKIDERVTPTSSRLVPSIHQAIASQPEWVQAVLAKEGAVVIRHDTGSGIANERSNYQAGIISIADSSYADNMNGTVAHEVGHLLDNNLGEPSTDKAFSKAFKEDGQVLKGTTPELPSGYTAANNSDLAAVWKRLRGEDQGNKVHDEVRKIRAEVDSYRPDRPRIEHDVLDHLENVRRAQIIAGEGLKSDAKAIAYFKRRPEAFAELYANTLGKTTTSVPLKDHMPKSYAFVETWAQEQEQKHALRKLRTSGDNLGHAFHGNQWTSKEPTIERHELGYISANGEVIAQKVASRSELMNTDHSSLGNAVQVVGPGRKFRYSNGNIEWNDIPTQDHLFKVSNHYPTGTTHTAHSFKTNPRPIVAGKPGEQPRFAGLHPEMLKKGVLFYTDKNGEQQDRALWEDLLDETLVDDSRALTEHQHVALLSLRTSDGWVKTDKGIEKTFSFPNRRASAAFTASLLEYANNVNHHPDVEVDGDDVHVTYITHATNSLTSADFSCAEEADRLAEATPTLEIVTAGDKEGHAFHGNQWSQRKKDEAEQAAKQTAFDSSFAIGVASPSGDVQTKEFATKDDADAHDDAGGFSGGHKLAFPGGHYQASNRFRREGNVIAWNEAPTADNYFAVENYYADRGKISEQRVWGGWRGKSGTWTINPHDDLRTAGDKSGHEFHGNQWDNRAGNEDLNFSAKEATDVQDKISGWLKKSIGSETVDPKTVKAFVAKQLSGPLRDAHDEKTLIAARDELRSLGINLKSGSTLSTDPAEAVAALLVRSWAVTSSDGHPVSIAIQEEARERFHLTGADDLGEAADKNNVEVSDGLKSVIGTYVQETYDQTQKMLADTGITHLTLFRGLAVDQDEAPRDGVQTIVTRPLSSFSTDWDLGQDYATKRYDEQLDKTDSATAIMTAVRVPASRVFSTFATGSGAHNESELVLLGGKQKAYVRTSDLEADENNDAFDNHDDFMKAAAASADRVKAKRASRE
jgi:4a-hydroxytetrahydrobiopterin dehydratase